MVLVVKDRIKDTSTTSGTGTITLANSPPNGFQAFSVLGNNSTTYYAIQDANNAFEIGLGTYNSNTLTRTTVLASSNSNNLVSLTSPSSLWVDYPASKAYLSEEGIDKSFTATASITAGKPVILNSAGTVTQVAETTTGAITEAYSSETALNDPSEKVVVVSNGNNTFLMVYQASSLYTTIQAGTMSGTTMTWGTAQVFESTDTSGAAVWWDSYRSCFVVCARSATGNSYVRVKTITVSGQAITIVDSEQTQVFGGSYNQSTMIGGYDSTAQVGFFVNSIGNSPTKTSIIVVSVDGSKQITFGSEVTSNDRIYFASQFVHDANGNGNVSVIGARYNSSTSVEVNSTQAYVITISGTTPTIKTPVVLNASAYKHGYSVYDASANKTICIYDDATKVYYNVCSMSSGTLTVGTHTEIATGGISDPTQEFAYAGSYNSFTQQIGITYHDSSNYYYLRSGKVSGASITWSNAIQVDPSTANKHVNVVNANSSNSNTLVLYWVNYDSAFNTWTIGKTGVTTSNLTTSNYLGVASTSASANASVNINIPGSINNDQTGLTIGRNYYTSGVGAISTTLSPNFVGRAISSTQLLLEEEKGNSLDGFSNNAITKGKPIVMQADGDVAQVTSTSSSGSEYISGTQQISTQENSSDQFYIANNGSGIFAVVAGFTNGYATIILGQDNGTAITWGSPLQLGTTVSNRGKCVYYDPDNDCFVASVMVSGGHCRSFIITYNGTTPTLGNNAQTPFVDTSIYVLASAYDTTNNKGYVTMGKYKGKMFAVTVSGSSITIGAVSAQFSGSENSAQFFNMVYDNTNNVGYVSYRNEAISDYPYLQTYTVSGTTFTFGTETVIESTAASNIVGVAEGSADSKGVLIAWKNSSGAIRYATPTFSGLAPTIGTVASVSTIPSGNSLYWEGPQAVNYNPTSQTFQISYQDTSSSKFDIVTNSATVSSGTVTWGAYKTVYATSNSSQYYVVNAPTGKNANNVYIIQQRYNQSPRKTAGSLYGAAYNNTTTNLTATNYLGIASDTVANNENVTIQTQGAVNPDQSSLTPAQLYYVQTNGTLSTTAGSPSVVAGIATSATTLLITRS